MGVRSAGAFSSMFLRSYCNYSGSFCAWAVLARFRFHPNPNYGMCVYKTITLNQITSKRNNFLLGYCIGIFYRALLEGTIIIIFLN